MSRSEASPYADASRYDVRSPEATQDAIAFWNRLRREAPVHFDRDLSLWFVTRYEDVQTVVQSPDRFGKVEKDDWRPVARLCPEAEQKIQPFRDEYVFTFEANPPDQAFFKRIARAPMLGSKVLGREPIARRLAHGLIDQFIDDGEVDLVNAFNFPLPAMYMFDYIGVPADDLSEIRRESLAMLDLWYGFPDPDTQISLADDFMRYWDRLKALVADHVAHPRADIVSDLLAAEDETGSRLAPMEVASMLRALVVGAHKTVSSLIGSTVYQLLVDRAARWTRVLDDPSLVGAAVNETLRTDSPAVGLFYVAFTDVELGGELIRKGDRVYACYLAANHDEQRFDDPDTWNMDRVENTRNLAFGGGIHLCPGTVMGRMLPTVAITALAERMPTLELVDETFMDQPVFFSHGPVRLPVRWEPPNQ
jgi:cytochrome P450